MSASPAPSHHRARHNRHQRRKRSVPLTRPNSAQNRTKAPCPINCTPKCPKARHSQKIRLLASYQCHRTPGTTHNAPESAPISTATTATQRRSSKYLRAYSNICKSGDICSYSPITKTLYIILMQKAISVIMAEI